MAPTEEHALSHEVLSVGGAAVVDVADCRCSIWERSRVSCTRRASKHLSSVGLRHGRGEGQSQGLGLRFAAAMKKKKIIIMRDTGAARVVGGPQHTSFTWL